MTQQIQITGKKTKQQEQEEKIAAMKANFAGASAKSIMETSTTRMPYLTAQKLIADSDAFEKLDVVPYYLNENPEFMTVSQFCEEKELDWQQGVKTNVTKGLRAVVTYQCEDNEMIMEFTNAGYFPKLLILSTAETFMKVKPVNGNRLATDEELQQVSDVKQLVFTAIKGAEKDGE